MRLRATLIAIALGSVSLMTAAPVAVSDTPSTAAISPAKPTAPDQFVSQVAPVLQKYCVGCHSGPKPKGEFDLTKFADEESLRKNRPTWDNLRHLVQAKEMPPEKRPQPTLAERDALLGGIEAILARNDCTGTRNPGRVTLRRLNRAEFNNTIRDLLGIEFRPADDFPADDSGYGFDNIGDVLSLPPVLLEKYLAAAERILEEAYAPPPGWGPSYRILNGRQVNSTVTAAPPANGQPPFRRRRLLTVAGELFVELDCARPGQYEFRPRLYGEQAGNETVRVAVKVDGKELKTADVKGTADKSQSVPVRFHATKGSHRFAVAFLNPYKDAQTKRERALGLENFEISGPHDLGPPPPSDSEQRIMIARPSANLPKRDAARKILANFARKAFRRPVTDAEIERLLKLFDMADRDGEPFEKAIRLPLQAVLVSPHFLFRVELDRTPTRPDGSYPVSDLELASRLAYFLWSSMPDEELVSLAERDQLRPNLEAQVRRMLRDPKSAALVENFFGQWLQTRNLKATSMDSSLFPAYTEKLRDAMLKETELFITEVVREDRSILDFLDADYTYVNERLARHYGIPDVRGEEFRRVSTKGTPRGGVLTMASILTITSNPTRTSPVKRGKWVLETILGTPPPPPPPNVPELEDQKQLTGSLRQRMEQHRTNPVCASCHTRMDAIGFGFENFDAIGSWRTKDGKDTIDPSGELPGGGSFRGPVDLKLVMKGKAEQFRRCLAEKLLTYALGRGLEYYDRCATDQISQAVAAGNDRFSRLVLEVVRSDPFQYRRVKRD